MYIYTRYIYIYRTYRDTSGLFFCYGRGRGYRKKNGIYLPGLVFLVEVWVILVELLRFGGHPEETRVQEHEVIATHAISDQRVVVHGS